eukprot:scaffold315598_cov37-Prasinocladus_malaysianus.AAC.1
MHRSSMRPLLHRGWRRHSVRRGLSAMKPAGMSACCMCNTAARTTIHTFKGTDRRRRPEMETDERCFRL